MVREDRLGQNHSTDLSSRAIPRKSHGTCWILRDSSSLSKRVRSRCSSCSRFSQAAWSCTRACCIFSTLSTYTCFFFSWKCRVADLQMERKDGNRVSYETHKSSLFLRFPPVSKRTNHETTLGIRSWLPCISCTNNGKEERSLS